VRVETCRCALDLACMHTANISLEKLVCLCMCVCVCVCVFELVEAVTFVAAPKMEPPCYSGFRPLRKQRFLGEASVSYRVS
jgi:hypothetical protein